MGDMNDIFGKPLFQPTGTDWIDHAFTAAILDDMEREKKARRSLSLATPKEDIEADIDMNIDPTTHTPNDTIRKVIDYRVKMAIMYIKQDYEGLGDWWTVCSSLRIHFGNAKVWFSQENISLLDINQKNVRDVYTFLPTKMPNASLCRIRKTIESWLKTKCDKHTIILTNHDKIVTSLLHYSNGTSDTETLTELKAMLAAGQILEQEFQKYTKIVQGFES